MNANSRLFFSKACLPKELNYSKADRQEIGNQAVWSLSSAKQGFGVEQLRDNNIETYWQSDGSQPHLVNIQFHKRSAILEVDVYVDYKSDESYTPSKISVRSGTTFHDLKEIKLIELEEPSGWVSIPLPHPSKPDGVLRTNFVQIAILSNHQNGRDTHVRQIRVYGPSRTYSPSDDMLGQFQSEDFLLYDVIK